MHPLVARTLTAAAGPLAAFARSVGPKAHALRDDPYLAGPNAPRTDELAIDVLSVTGTLPPDLDGMYVRNGPNPQFEPIAYSFPFDGDGMLHAVTLRDGRASYRNRWVETAGLRAERRAGRAIYGSVGSPFPISRRLVGDDGDPSPVKNAANTNVIGFAGRVLALYEAGLPYELDAQLCTRGTYSFDGRLSATMTAHPKLDPRDGSLHFFRYAVDVPRAVYYEADAHGTIVRELEIELDATTIVHDCLLTERSFVLVVAPLIFDLAAIMRGKPAFRYEPERGTQIIIVDRRDRAAAPQRIATDGFYFWHFLNGYERDTTLVVDLIVHRSLEASIDPRGPMPSLVRLEVDRVAGRVRFEPRDERYVELPRVADAVAGRPYRFGYAAAAGVGIPRNELPAATFDGLVRYDMERGAAEVRRFAPGVFVGEPSVVPKAVARDEHDAYVVTYAYDRAVKRSSLVILDAADFAGPPVATVELPVRVPNGYHGNWIARTPAVA